MSVRSSARRRDKQLVCAVQTTRFLRSDSQSRPAELNGGRVGHFSRGFFPDGVRRAEVQSLSAFSETTGEPSPWITRIWT